jgi:hypothetical protein
VAIIKIVSIMHPFSNPFIIMYESDRGRNEQEILGENGCFEDDIEVLILDY